jgi:hypothetical protein
MIGGIFSLPLLGLQETLSFKTFISNFPIEPEIWVNRIRDNESQLYFKIKMTWLLVLSGSKGFVIPKIILTAIMYCMFRPQLSKIFTNENQIFFV